MEVVVLIMMVLAPWSFGAVEPIALVALYAGLALLGVLYALRMLLEKRLLWQRCPLTVCVGVLLLTGVGQLLPMSKGTLSGMSPQTAELYASLLPQRAEVLPFGQPLEPLSPPAGTTLSIYPHATRSGLAKLLAALLLLVFVRNGFASPASLRRLAILACVNGAALSLFALIQFLTSHANEIYWSVETLTQPYGPFVCKNHFPFYTNICLALGFGWLCSVTGWQTAQTLRPPHAARDVPTGAFAHRRRGRPSTGGHPQPAGSLALWLGIGLCLSLMTAAVALSMSRGGLLTLAATATLAAVILLTHSRQVMVWGAVGIMALAGVSLVAWMGSERLESRVETILSGEAIENRLPLWSRTIGLVRDFPLWGTGLGTFEVVEPLTRRLPSDGGVLYDHAHNEYVEAIVEGGIVRLVVMLVGLGIALAMGWRGVAGDQGAATSGLALGALLGIVSVAIHSIGEFGIHIPAITILVVVVAAHLSALASSDRTVTPDSRTKPIAVPSTEPRSRIGLALAAGVFVGLPLILCWQGWQTHVAHAHLLAAGPLSYESSEEIKLAQIGMLQSAVDATPTSAQLRHELAERQLALYQQRLLRLAEGRSSGGQTESGESQDEPSPPTERLPSGDSEPPSQSDAAGGQLIAEQLVPALRHLVQARNLCPLLPEPQFALAANVDRFARADSPEHYLRRVQRLAPADPRLWYLVGQQQLLDGLHQDAWQSWRRSLSLSEQYLPEIVPLALEHLTPEELRDRVLPADAAVLLAAALHPAISETSASEPAATDPVRLMLLQAARRTLESENPNAWDADQYFIAGEIDRQLGQRERAVENYRTAVEREPEQFQWRMQLAKSLLEAGRIEEARRQAELIISRNPAHAEAREFLARIRRQPASASK